MEPREPRNTREGKKDDEDKLKKTERDLSER